MFGKRHRLGHNFACQEEELKSRCIKQCRFVEHTGIFGEERVQHVHSVNHHDVVILVRSYILFTFMPDSAVRGFVKIVDVIFNLGGSGLVFGLAGLFIQEKT